MFWIVGLKIWTRELPSRGRIAKVHELKSKRTKASLFVQAASSTHRFVFPLLSKEGLSSGDTKLKSLKLTDKEVAKLVKRAWQ
jgi:hypothetical protein